MNKILGGFKDMLLRHKILSVICFLAVIIVVMLLYVFFSIFIGGGGKYGNRLSGIEDVKISKSKITEIKETVSKNGEVDSVKVRVQGKIVYFDIIYTKDTSLDKAKEIASKSLDNFSDDEKEFYDFEYVMTQNMGDDDKTGFKVTGTKGPKTDGISFIKS